MKKFLLLLIILFAFAGFIQAQDEPPVYPDEVTLDFNAVKVVFDPSPDERVTGHVIYYYNVADPSIEFCEVLEDKTVTEYMFNSGLLEGAEDKTKVELYPGHSYIFTAAAFNRDTGDMSIRSNSVRLNVRAQGIPETFRPEPYTFVLRPESIQVEFVEE